MAIRKKCILFTVTNASQHGYSKILDSIFENTDYYIQSVFIEKYVNIYYILYNRLSKQFYKLSPSGTGVNLFIKKILCRTGLNKFLGLIGCIIDPFHYIIHCILYMVRWWIYTQKLDKIFKHHIKELSAVAILWIPPFEPWEICYFPKTGLPVIVVANYMIVNISDTVASDLLEKFQSRGTLERLLLDMLAPHWAYTYDSKRIYTARPLFLLSTLLYGVKKRKHTAEGLSRYAGGCLFSMRHKEVIEEYGMQVPDNWRITGEISSDVLTRRQQDRDLLLPLFFERYGFSQAKTLAFDLHRFPEKHLERLLYIAQRAGDFGWNVIFCPHPGLDQRFMTRCEQAGFAVSVEPTLHVLPFVDLYVSYESSTCYWAAQLGLPTLSIGIWGRLGATQWAGSLYFEPSDAELFYSKIESILHNTDAYTVIHRQAKESSSHYGALDGKCSERTRDYIIDIIMNWNHELE